MHWQAAQKCLLPSLPFYYKRIPGGNKKPEFIQGPNAVLVHPPYHLLLAFPIKSQESENIPEGVSRDHQAHTCLTNIFVTIYNFMPSSKRNKHIFFSFRRSLKKGLTFTRPSTDARGISICLSTVRTNHYAGKLKYSFPTTA